jgi:DNA-directed RNA polymerase III subunit RPC6
MADPSDELYNCCAEVARASPEGHKKVFKQDELLSLCQEQYDSKLLNDVTDPHKLIPLVSQLCGAALLYTLKSGGHTCWGLRPQNVATEVRKLGKDERMVYECIEASYEDGMWIRLIKNKTGIKDGPSLDKLLKRLMSLQLVKSVRNAKAMTQKTYMLAYLNPSDEVTGGSLYDGGELDESMVGELTNMILFYVRQVSWGSADGKRKRTKKEASPIPVLDEDGEPAPAVPDSRSRKKRKSGSGTAARPVDIEDATHSRKQRSHKHGYDPETDPHSHQLTLPPGHRYPNASQIHTYILQSNILRAVKAASLTVAEVKNMLNVLVWDEKLEEINEGYRTVRGVKPQQPGVEDGEGGANGGRRGNGLTEAPCGSCPVIDVCGNGGPINAASCVYYGEWLSQKASA